MNPLKCLGIVALMALFIGCSAAQKTYSSNPRLDDMMSQQEFEFSPKFAQPMMTAAMSNIAMSGLIAPGSTMSQINLNSSGYYLRVHGDSVSANLAYFGERQMSSGYHIDAGIVFDGVPKNIEISKDAQKQNYTIKFSINQNAENFRVIATTETNLSATITVVSSHRSRIRYMGDVDFLKEENVNQ